MVQQTAIVRRRPSAACPAMICMVVELWRVWICACFRRAGQGEWVRGRVCLLCISYLSSTAVPDTYVLRSICFSVYVNRTLFLCGDAGRIVSLICMCSVVATACTYMSLPFLFFSCLRGQQQNPHRHTHTGSPRCTSHLFRPTPCTRHMLYSTLM